MEVAQLELKGMQPGVQEHLRDGPTLLRNLVPGRLGGLRPWGLVASMNQTLVGTLIGHDDAGYSSFNSAGTYRLYNGTTFLTSSIAVVGSPVHIPNAGAYSTRSSFGLYDAGGTARSPITTPGLVSVTPEAAGKLPAGDYELWQVTLLRTAAGSFATSMRWREFTIWSPDTKVVIAATSNIGAYEHHIFLRRRDEPALFTFAGIVTTNTPLTVTEMPVGPAFTHAALLAFRGGVSEVHKRRVWGIPNVGAMEYSGTRRFYTELHDTLLHLVWSDIGYGNVTTDGGWLKIQATASQRITALVSSPAGLVVFCDNEAFLVQGDPDGSDFAVTRFPAAIGCDWGVRPVKLGSVIYVIWKGRVYAISLGAGDVDFGGMMKEVSMPVFNPNAVGFRALAAEPDTKDILALGPGLYRYNQDRDFWSLVPTGEVSRLLPHPTGTRLVMNDNSMRQASGGTDSALIGVSLFSAGRINERKVWRRVVLPYNSDEAVNGSLLVTAFDTQPGLGAAQGKVVQGVRERGALVFTLPPGMVSKHLSFDLALTGLTRTVEFGPILEVMFTRAAQRRP